MSSELSRRRLPHVYPEDAWLFVTWHLYGALPPGLYPPPGKASAGRAFVWMDRYLDTAEAGPTYLKRPEIADVLVSALQQGVVDRRYELAAFVVMSNHVHVLIRPLDNPSRVLQWLKGTTSREANILLGLTGKPFWQRESYDHWVRNWSEFARIIAYVENNPVKAGVVADATLYKWSSAWTVDGELKFTAAR